mgnify:CR=1 FL=1
MSQVIYSLLEEAKNIIQIYGSDTVAGIFAQNVINSYEHILVVDKLSKPIIS